MTTLTELRRWAENDRDTHLGGCLDGEGETIIQLLDLIAQCKEALNSKYILGCGAWVYQRDQALAAIEQWEKK